MKTVIAELTLEASRELLKATKGGRIILTRRGKPVAYVLPAAVYDEEDIGYMTDPAFWAMIRERRREDAGESIPLEEVEAKITALEHTEREVIGSSPKPSKKKSNPNGRKGSPRNASA
jgi:antitoxin (DNA-binding transcriptional repressor) of toxin-antitoxin stability system